MSQAVAHLFGIDIDAPHLAEALTHPSYANEQRSPEDNQRLEFLGDAVLELCVSELLCAHFPEADEGTLTRMRASVVNTEALAGWARQNGVPDALMLGRGAESNGLRDSSNVLADAVEALLAAAYLDAGIEAARAVTRLLIEPELAVLEQGGVIDPKTELQEAVQADGLTAPRYEVLDSGGPAHERWFMVAVRVDDRVLGEGRGRSKRAAERAAAVRALATRCWMPESARGEGCA